MRLIVAGFLAAAWAASVGAAAAEPIRIGTFLPVTGQGAFLGAPALATLRLQVQAVNAAGGVLGRRLDLVLYDVGLDATRAQTAVRRLIDVDKVDFIIGGATTGASMAVIPIVQSARIPFISLAAAVAIVEPVKRWVFKTAPTDLMACARIFADMKKRRLGGVAMFTGNGGFGRSMRHQCRRVAELAGLKLVADEVFDAADAGEAGLSGRLKGLAAGKDVETILVAAAGEAPAVITRAYNRLGLRQPLYQSHAVANRRFLRRAGKAAAGVRLPAPALLVARKLVPGDPQAPVLARFTEAYKKKWGVSPTAEAGYAYDGLAIALAALKRAGGTDPEKMRSEIERTRGYVGASGVYDLSARDHLGLSPTAFRMVEIRGGDWVIVD